MKNISFILFKNHLPDNSHSLGCIFIKIIFFLRVFSLSFGPIWCRRSAKWELTFHFPWHYESGKKLKRICLTTANIIALLITLLNTISLYILRLYTKALYHRCKKNSTELYTIYLDYQSSVPMYQISLSKL